MTRNALTLAGLALWFGSFIVSVMSTESLALRAGAACIFFAMTAAFCWRSLVQWLRNGVVKLDNEPYTVNRSSQPFSFFLWIVAMGFISLMFTGGAIVAMLTLVSIFSGT